MPAIDILGGRCVRLYQGDYSKETVFSDDPLEVALKWQSMGAPRIHIVDLDGAKTGEIANFEVIHQIARALLVPAELGGGIRDAAAVEKILKAGIDRVVLGTAAVENPQFVAEVCRNYRESIVVGVDALKGKVAIRGWRQGTQLDAVSFARSMIKLGVRRFIYTDINRDGTLTEPNFAEIAGMIDNLRVPIVASGGVASLQHLTMLKKLGAEGAIVGKALYTGDINLKKALNHVERM
ncbi:MAG: 1-(5-phosphoribosyl)-5-[(5-phosphoribosylamino)methylideneamino]imidazole-4-carboxamide isomerase [Dehalococcoidales bacterium]|nr:1-(5-phosphoribosyl)-5-[(5-phosphoribosylamino)methylideneamino]imidazole-4-carboxamide isomerase [Dehalococcoidales bacterium]